MRVLRTMTLSVGAFCLAASAGCGGTDLQPDMPDPSVIDRSADDLGLPQAPEDGAPDSGGEDLEAEASEEPPRQPVRVVVGEHEPVEGPTPTVRIVAPRNGQRLALGSAALRLQATNWPLQAEPGRHLHVIVDDEPYIAVRDISGPLDLLQMVRDHLGHELSQGTHVLRVFPSRGHHESVKMEGAFASVVFHYGAPSASFAFDPEAPLLTYSRPKGCNVAGRILLDFYVSNASLSEDGLRVRYDIDDGTVSGDIVRWAPHWIENLPEGEHRITLSLVTATGEALPGPFNRPNRTFRVAARCP